MTLSNSDLFLVNRGGTDYSVSFDKLMADIDGLITVGDGEITITQADGTEVGKFSVNQAGDATIALPQVVIPESLHPKGFINVANPAPADPEHGDIYIQSSGGGGDVTAHSSFSPGIGGTVEEGVFVIFGVDDKWHAGGQANPTSVQTDWNETDVTSDAFLKNKPDIQGTIDASIGTGNLKIQTSEGVELGTFNANQVNDELVTLPEAFSGDWNDLDNQPVIGDGVLEVINHEGTLLVDFSANQTNSEVLRLPAPPEVNNGELQLQDPTGATKVTFSANQAVDQPAAVYLKDSYIQHLPVLT